jgi:iron complex outermembrane recepter protein
MSTFYLKSILLASVAATSVVVCAAPSAIAQEEEAGVGDIIITARRVEEKLQDVPASVTVFTADVLEKTGVKTASDFVKLTPGVTIVTGTAEAGDTQINIRGINGARDAENNVALVVDGILKTQVAALNQDQGAIKQIEVLKGPQGALYGRNAAAGAIVVTTRKPGEEFQIEGRASYGNNETYTVSALASGPISEGAGFVISGDYSSSDGYFRNTFLPLAVNQTVYPGNSSKAASMDDYERYNINGRLVFNVGESTEIDLKGRYGKVKAGAIVFNAAFQIPGLFDVSQTVSSNIDVNDHLFKFDPNIDPGNDQKTVELSGRVTTDFGFATMNAYVAYSDIQNSFFADGTSGTFGFFANEPTCIATTAALPASVVVVQEPFQTIGGFRGSQPYSPTSCDGTQYQERNQEDISGEIRFVSNSDGPLQWQFGGYLLHIKRRVCINLGVDTGRGVVEECFTTDARNPTEALADDTFKTNVYAAFGAIDYDVTEQFKIGVALRYDIEDRKVSNNVPTGRLTRWVGNVLTGNPNGTATTPANYFLNPGLDPVYNPSGVLAPRDQTFKQLQPKINLTYEINPSTTFFANWGIGFKSGGFNASGGQAIIDGFFNNGTALFVPGNPINAGLTIPDTYQKEKSSAFEVGLKGAFLDGRVNFELAGYYTEVTDMQFFEFFVGPFGLLRVVSNMDKAELYGFEAGLNVRVLDGWNVFGAFNYTDSKIKENRARPYTVGNKAPYTSDYTVNLGTQVTAPVTDAMDMIFRADWRLTGPTWFHTVQDNSVPNFFFGNGVLQGNFKNSRRDSYNVLNARFGLQGESWGVNIFANNLLGEDYLAEVIPAPEFGGDFISPGQRRSYGIEASFKF